MSGKMHPLASESTGTWEWYEENPMMDKSNWSNSMSRPLTMPDEGNPRWEEDTPATEAAERKEHPMATGVLDYFPNAMYELAHVSYVATQQHHPGTAMHWDKAKSPDHADSLLRHLKDRGLRDTDGERHTTKVAWRALALLEIEILAEKAGMTPEAYIAYLKAGA